MDRKRYFNNILIADNSSGIQMMSMQLQDDGEATFTVTGNYKGDDIQLDFEGLTALELRQLAAKITYIAGVADYE
tara:strand:- start:77497 stop:77721 length:225 start_codon:yes stop_codon:yes gene_type:complete